MRSQVIRVEVGSSNSFPDKNFPCQHSYHFVPKMFVNTSNYWAFQYIKTSSKRVTKALKSPPPWDFYKYIHSWDFYKYIVSSTVPGHILWNVKKIPLAPASPFVVYICECPLLLLFLSIIQNESNKKYSQSYKPSSCKSITMGKPITINISGY